MNEIRIVHLIKFTDFLFESLYCNLKIIPKHIIINFPFFNKKGDRAERNYFWSRFLLFILLFFFHLYLEGKRKGEKKKHSLGQKSCLSARSKKVNINSLNFFMFLPQTVFMDGWILTVKSNLWYNET